MNKLIALIACTGFLCTMNGYATPEGPCHDSDCATPQKHCKPCHDSKKCSDPKDKGKCHKDCHKGDSKKPQEDEAKDTEKPSSEE